MTFHALTNLVFCWLTEARSQGVKGPNCEDSCLRTTLRFLSKTLEGVAIGGGCLVSHLTSSAYITLAGLPLPPECWDLEVQDNTPSRNFSLCGCSGN